jgi:hypothetical protein
MRNLFRGRKYILKSFTQNVTHIKVIRDFGKLYYCSPSLKKDFCIDPADVNLGSAVGFFA